MLAMVRALIRRTGHETATVEDYQSLLDGRVAALVRAHTAAMRDLENGVSLSLLIADEMMSFGLHQDEGFRIEGADQRLTPRAAGLTALLFHELVMLAILRGSIVAGRSIAIGWESDPEGLRVRWREEAGETEPDAVAARVEWIRQAIAYDLGGSLTIEKDGESLTFTLALPAGSLIAVR